MQPVPGKVILPREGARLGDLVLMMRKDQVDSARMDVEDVHAKLLADQLERHGGAFEVPAGTAAAERRIPRGPHRLVVGLRRLPEDEVAGVLLGILVGADPFAGAGLQLAGVQA